MNKEELKKISVDVMDAQVAEYIRKWSCFGPFKTLSKTDEKIVIEDNIKAVIDFPRPHLEDLTKDEGLGKAICLLVKDPGMHGLAMDLYGTKDIPDLEDLRLADFCGNPSDLGKAVAKALND